MSAFIELKALGGTHYVRAGQVIAVQYAETSKCTVLLAGGGALSCAEAAAQVRARIETALQHPDEAAHGDGSR